MSQQIIPHLADYTPGSFSRGRPAVIELAWMLVQAAFVSSWVPGSTHRRWLLRAFGARIGPGVVVKPRVRVKFPWRLEVGEHTWIGEGAWIDNLAAASIGANCCISQDAYLCTGSHDWSSPSFDLRTAAIRVDDGAWVAARATVGPGVTVGKGAVLGLGSVATNDLAPWTVSLGVPAVEVGKRNIAQPLDGEGRCHPARSTG